MLSQTHLYATHWHTSSILVQDNSKYSPTLYIHHLVTVMLKHHTWQLGDRRSHNRIVLSREPERNVSSTGDMHKVTTLQIHSRIRSLHHRWTNIKKRWWQHCQTGATMDTARPQRKRATNENLEKRSGERNVDSRIQVQLEEDGGGSTRQMDGDKWSVAYHLPMFHREQKAWVKYHKSCASNTTTAHNCIIQALLILYLLYLHQNTETRISILKVVAQWKAMIKMTH